MTLRHCSALLATSLLLLPPVLIPAQTAHKNRPAATALDRAWTMLTENVSPDKPAHDRIVALAALSTLGTNHQAARLIGDSIIGHNMDVRTAAILAAGETKNPELLTRLHAALDDDQPQVAYAAAATLWKMHDNAGEELLLAVAAGERHSKPGLIQSSKHKASKDLHSPTTMATLGLEHGAGFFLGPFGFGVSAIEYARKNGGDSGRATALDLLSEEHSEAVHDALIDALDDHEAAVRVAAAKGLAKWPGSDTAKRLLPFFDDEKLPVRLTAAAAYIRSQSPALSRPRSGLAPRAEDTTPPPPPENENPAPAPSAPPASTPTSDSAPVQQPPTPQAH